MRDTIREISDKGSTKQTLLIGGTTKDGEESREQGRWTGVRDTK